MKTIHLVTGASGHLGNALCRALILQGEKVRAMLLPGDTAPALAGLDVERVEADLAVPDSLETLFQNLESYEKIYLYHLAGFVTIRGGQEKILQKVNVEGTRALVEAAKKHKVTRFLYTSSVHAIPESPKGEMQYEVNHFDPDKVHGDYAKSKAAATQIVLDAHKEGLDVVVVHPSGIIGPYDFGNGHLTQLLLNYINGKIPCSVQGGYDFVDVRDVVQAEISAMKNGRSGECYIASGHYTTIHDLFCDIAELSGKRKKRCIVPYWAAKLSAAIAEFFTRKSKKAPLFTRYSVYTLMSNSLFSHEKASRELNYKARPLRETLRETVAFLQEQKRFKRAFLLNPQAIIR